MVCDSVYSLQNDGSTMNNRVFEFNLSNLLVCPDSKSLLIEFNMHGVSDALEVSVHYPDTTYSLYTGFRGSRSYPVFGDTIYSGFGDYTLFFNGNPQIRERGISIPPGYSLPLGSDGAVGTGRVQVNTFSDSVTLRIIMHPTRFSTARFIVKCDNEFEVIRTDTNYVCYDTIPQLEYIPIVNCDTVIVYNLYVGQTIPADTVVYQDNNLAGDTIRSYYVNPFGCEILDTIYVFIPIPEPTIKLFIPNVFSPNWDGINDLFVIPNARRVHIYARNGGLVYSCDSFSTCERGWGPYVDLEPGVYAWIAEFEERGETIILTGDITLLR